MVGLAGGGVAGSGHWVRLHFNHEKSEEVGLGVAGCLRVGGGGQNRRERRDGVGGGELQFERDGLLQSGRRPADLSARPPRTRTDARGSAAAAP